MLSIGGDNLQFYPNFALFSTLGGMNLEHNFFQVSKLSEEQKKRSSPKRNQARSQKFAIWGGLIFGFGAELPAAEGQWGLGSRRRHGGLGTESPALKNVAFFCKNSLILELF